MASHNVQSEMCTDKHAIHALMSVIALVPHYAMSLVLTHTLSTGSAPYTRCSNISPTYTQNVHNISPTYTQTHTHTQTMPTVSVPRTQCPSMSPTLTHTYTRAHTRARAHSVQVSVPHARTVQVSVPHKRIVRTISATYLACFGLILKLRHPKI